MWRRNDVNSQRRNGRVYIRDLLYNQCIDNPWCYSIFIYPTGRIRVNKIRFVSTGENRVAEKLVWYARKILYGYNSIFWRPENPRAYCALFFPDTAGNGFKGCGITFCDSWPWEKKTGARMLGFCGWPRKDLKRPWRIGYFSEKF